jgi:hypothetical protein
MIYLLLNGGVIGITPGRRATQGPWGPQWWLGGRGGPACRWPKPLGLGSMWSTPLGSPNLWWRDDGHVHGGVPLGLAVHRPLEEISLISMR